MSKRAKQSFAFGNDDGSITVVNEETIYADNHPLVKARPLMFRDLDEEAVPNPRDVVEQATAAPGELRRGPGRPRKEVADE